MQESSITLVSEYYREKYGQKVYKLPVNFPVTCPTRMRTEGDAIIAVPWGTGFESFTNNLSFGEQIRRNQGVHA